MHPIFAPLYTSEKRYFFLTGGRASLKTSNVMEFIVELCRFMAGHGVLYTRYTMVSAEQSIIPELRIVTDRMGVTDEFDWTKKTVTHKTTGSFILFSGIKASSGDQTGRLKSIAGITTWVVEEGEDFKDEKAFDIIDNSIRTAGKQNRVIWIQNPTTKEHFIYNRWTKPANKKIDVHGFDVTVSAVPEVCHIHSTYHIAEEMRYLDEGWLAKADRLRQAMEEKVSREKAQAVREGKSAAEIAAIEYRVRHTSRYYYTYIGGWLERAEGVIFDNWIEGEFDDTLPYCYALDYGYYPDPLAMAKIAVDKKKRRIYVKEEIYETNLDDVVARLDLLGIPKRALIVSDTNEPRTTQRIKKAGYNIVKAVKREIVEDIRDIKTYLIIVDPKSVNLKVEFNNYIWNDKKASIPIGDYNHLIDGMRYGYNRLTRKKSKGVRRRN